MNIIIKITVFSLSIVTYTIGNHLITCTHIFVNFGSILSHTLSVCELCEMRNEKIVWKELFVYDDIVKCIDYIYIQ